MPFLGGHFVCCFKLALPSFPPSKRVALRRARACGTRWVVPGAGRGRAAPFICLCYQKGRKKTRLFVAKKRPVFFRKSCLKRREIGFGDQPAPQHIVGDSHAREIIPLRPRFILRHDGTPPFHTGRRYSRRESSISGGPKGKRRIPSGSRHSGVRLRYGRQAPCGHSSMQSGRRQSRNAAFVRVVRGEQLSRRQDKASGRWRLAVLLCGKRI